MTKIQILISFVAEVFMRTIVFLQMFGFIIALVVYAPQHPWIILFAVSCGFLTAVDKWLS